MEREDPGSLQHCSVWQDTFSAEPSGLQAGVSLLGEEGAALKGEVGRDPRIACEQRRGLRVEKTAKQEP